MHDLHTGAYWLPIMPKVRVKVLPATRPLLKRARARAREILAAGGPEANEEAGEAYSEDLARLAIVGWEGVGDGAGKPLKFSPQALEAFILDPVAFRAFDETYLGAILQRDAEKNGSSASLTGPSSLAAAGKATAKAATKSVRNVRSSGSSRARPKAS